MVWDLDPVITIRSPGSPDPETSGPSDPNTPSTRPQPVSYVVQFPHPLTTVSSHPSTSKELLVSDSRGSIFLTDWRTDPDENVLDSWRNSSVIELVEPRALSDAVSGASQKWSGSASWRRDSVDMYVSIHLSLSLFPSFLLCVCAVVCLGGRDKGPTSNSKSHIKSPH